MWFFLWSLGDTKLLSILKGVSVIGINDSEY